MTECTVWYEGDLSTRVVHQENGAEILTDAPKDNQGLGRVFSPTDLIGVALGSCVLTLMGIAARGLKIEIKGTRAHVTKEMASLPLRRIGKLKIEVFCPYIFPDDVVERLKKVAMTCPVHASLHPDVIQEFIFHWGTA